MVTANVSNVNTTTLGFPRMGRDRELKKALESYWSGKMSKEDFLQAAADVEDSAWKTQADALASQGEKDYTLAIDGTMYDQTLDWLWYLGLAPARFDNYESGSLEQYFAMARGAPDCHALSMRKWFDTNYHYLVPEFDASSIQRIKSGENPINAAPLVEKVKRACKLVGKEKLSLLVVGPVTLITLAKSSVDPKQLLELIMPRYIQVIQQVIAETGISRVQLNEPCLILDSAKNQKDLFKKALGGMEALPAAIDIITYYGYVDAEVYSWLKTLPFDSLSLDFCTGAYDGDDDSTLADKDNIVINGSAAEHLNMILSTGFPEDRSLICGLIDGRSVQKDEDKRIDTILALLTGKVTTEALSGDKVIAPTKLVISSSSSLLHLPYDLDDEPVIDEEESDPQESEDVIRQKWYATKRGLPKSVRSNLAFATQKVFIMAAASDRLNKSSLTNVPGAKVKVLLESQRPQYDGRPSLEEMAKILGLETSDLVRSKPFAARRPLQVGDQKQFMTTTIGSMPQTKRVRLARSALLKKKISPTEYESIIDEQIAFAVGAQIAIGIDVLVHGEFERTDMVEFFAERLRGYYVTSKAWVQSYGSRCIRPPIITSKIEWVAPTTVREFKVATNAAMAAFQDPTKVPAVKGMMTGPVTMLNWSFVARPVSRKTIAKELSYVIAREVKALEDEGAKVVQVDEPALREGLPLKRSERGRYLAWATGAFRLSTAPAKEGTQLVTHLCYSDIDDSIGGAISDLDADVLTIETSRTDVHSMTNAMKALNAAGNPLTSKKRKNGPSEQRDIGAGVYDVHSPVIPNMKTMSEHMKEVMNACLSTSSASKDPSSVRTDRIWINPDCGLKTRSWQEVIPSLQNMVGAARLLREEYDALYTKN